MSTHWRQKVKSLLIFFGVVVVILVLLVFGLTAVYTSVLTSSPTNGGNVVVAAAAATTNAAGQTQSSRISLFNNESAGVNRPNSFIDKHRQEYSPANAGPAVDRPIFQHPPGRMEVKLNGNKTEVTLSNESSVETSVVVDTPDIDLTTADLAGLVNVEYIKPAKIHVQPLHADDLLYESKSKDASVRSNDNLERHHITGHFRNKSSRIWDPHPQYEIDAFGLHFHLILYHDGDIMSKDIKITHVWPNATLRKKDDHKDHEKLRGCFYKGHVRGDERSTVAVSLCDGMRGHIRTSFGSFFIQPIEKFTNENTNILHALYRLPNVDEPIAVDNTYVDRSTVPRELFSDLIGPRGKDVKEDEYSETMERQHRPIVDDAEWTEQDTVGHFFKPTNGEGASTSVATVRSFHRRHKRNANANNAYTMEVLVAVDKKMQEYHGDAIQSYIITLMSIVSSIYSDASIGNSINVAVVHILLLKEDLVVNSNLNGVSASAMLSKFCSLKTIYNFHHDTALLLTREQICRTVKQEKCDILGLTELGTMCRPHSCAIVQDNGLSAAFTMAHELGHVLNMPHDDDPKCTKFNEPLKRQQNIMSRVLDHNTHPWSWSNCSRHFVTEFLENNTTHCLLDKPERDLIEPNSMSSSLLAGEKFTNDRQCELVFGPGSKICSYMPVCSRLWCSDVNEVEGCRTQHMPWADGTTCEADHWCQKGNCVHKRRSAPKPINGGWSPWSSFSECTQTCGGGLQASTRVCDSPSPSHGGRYCPGPRIKYQACGKHNCPTGTLEFREQQCQDSNNNNFDIPGVEKNVKWVPKYGAAPADECKLYCRVQNSTTYFLLKDKVKDGTLCTHEGFNKCINGVCRPAGCDHELYSSSKLDKCGVCEGQNETCVDVFGAFTHQQLREIGSKGAPYYKVVRIPRGASNIEILQPGHTDDYNYLALMDDQGGYLLNGNNLVTTYPNQFPYAGVTFQYNGAISPIERINTTYSQQLKRDLIVKVLSIRQMDRLIDRNLVTYAYTVSKVEHAPMPHTPQKHYRPTPKANGHHVPHHWLMSEWSECNQICFGERFRMAVCHQSLTGTIVANHYCHAVAKPKNEYAVCNEDCKVDWKVTRSECSARCGEGVRKVKYECVQQYLDFNHSNIVDDSYCAESSTNPLVEQCVGACEDATWSYGDWERCSRTCGEGVQNRTVTCLSHEGGTPVDENYCLKMQQKSLMRLCSLEPCPEWTYGDETPCSVTCGEGSRTKVIVCKQNNVTVNSALCGSFPRPVAIMHPCKMQPCAKKISSEPVMRFIGNVHTQTRDQDIYVVPQASHLIISIAQHKYEWRFSRWGMCSVSCGPGGRKMRTVRCVHKSEMNLEYVKDSACDQSTRPENVTTCGFTCPQWNTGPWSECNEDCKKYRQVICRDDNGLLNNSQCQPELRPPNMESCCHFRWRTVWTQCSVKCGDGHRTRARVCMKLYPKSATNPHPIKKGKHVEGKFCPVQKSNNFKSQTKPCRKQCDFRWEASAWLECSSGCGTGFTRRNITCTNGRQISISAKECKATPPPTTMKQCSSRNHCRWRAGKWKNCTCGGYTKRHIVCMDNLQNTRSNGCAESDKPPHKQRCHAPPNCTCKSIKHSQNAQRDGEYKINVRGRNVSIYCHKMNTEHPIEYLTLRAGTSENYSVYYGKRSSLPDQCPRLHHYTAQEAAKQQTEFWDDAIPHGRTEFQRVRIDLHSLRVNEHDFEFSHTSGRRQKFATAGDCYSTTEQCPQGNFSINFEDTGFRIRPNTLWDTEGQNAALMFNAKLEYPYQKVSAQCGGYCGRCFPSEMHNLHLDVL